MSDEQHLDGDVDQEYIPVMAPLQEEQDPQPLAASEYARIAETRRNDPTHRRLRAIAGAKVPYVLLTFPEGGEVSIDFWGIVPEGLSGVLDAVSEAVAV